MSQRVDNIIIGINASRARSGGAFAHLAGILNELDPLHYGIHEVHVWSYPKLLNSLLDAPWLIKHSPPELEKSLFHQVIWEYRKLPVLLAEKHCSILLNLDAGSLCRYQPSVTMSRDMLSYEPGEIQRFGFSLARIRLLLLRYMQNASLKRADGVIFLTQYAANVIQSSCGVLKNVRIVPHGVADNFRQSPTNYLHASGGENKINLLYVSNSSYIRFAVFT